MDEDRKGRSQTVAKEKRTWPANKSMSGVKGKNNGKRTVDGKTTMRGEPLGVQKKGKQRHSIYGTLEKEITLHPNASILGEGWAEAEKSKRGSGAKKLNSNGKSGGTQVGVRGKEIGGERGTTKNELCRKKEVGDGESEGASQTKL